MQFASYPISVWRRFSRFMQSRNEAAVAAWSLNLQFRRRYTHPDYWIRLRAKSLPAPDRFHPLKLATMLPRGI